MARLVSKPVRVVDIAREAGVSRVAAARVLLGSGGDHVRVSKATAETIRRIAKKLKYRPNIPARQLAGKRSHLIATIIDSYAPKLAYDLLADMERQAARKGYRFMVGQSHGELDHIREYASDFAARGVDGVVCISHNYPENEHEIADMFARLENVVFVGKPASQDQDLCYVDTDIASGISQAVEHLFNKGRRRIGITLLDSEFVAIRERKRGYLEAHRRLGLPVKQERIYLLDAGKPGVDEKQTETAVRELVGQKVEAILAQNDIGAICVIRSCRRLGCRVPEDIAVVGFDNIQIDNIPITSLFEPGITTVDQNLAEVSQRAMEMLINLIEGKDLPVQDRHVVVKPSLVVRASTAPPPDARAKGKEHGFAQKQSGV